MEISNEQYGRLAKFLDMEMTREEMDAFAMELEDSPLLKEQLRFELSLREELALHPEILDGSRSDAENSMKTAFRLPEKKQPAGSTIRWIISTAAACILVTMLITHQGQEKKDPDLISTINSKKEPDKNQNSVTDTTHLQDSAAAERNRKDSLLFKKHFIPEKIPANYPPKLSEPLIAYAEDDLLTIENADLSLYLDSRDGDADSSAILETGHFYKAMAYMKNGNFSEAIKQLQLSMRAGMHVLPQERKQWYLALALLKTGEREKAIGILRNLSGSNTLSVTAREARTLLKELND